MTDMIVKTPQEYAGEPRCFMCCISPGNVLFPGCSFLLPGGKRYTHAESCVMYSDYAEQDYTDYLCERCSEAEGL